jgi:hypothetical protein
MIIRPASTLGHLDVGWISSKRTFSNNSYWDPRYKRWKSLRVINDDCQQPGNVVPKHRHDAFDILGYMISGHLKHWDSLSNITHAYPGQIQHMHCGSGIYHTESSLGPEPARYLQIWVINPDFEQAVKEEPYYQLLEKGTEFGPLPVTFKSGMKISGGILDGQHTLPTRSAYIYIVSGTVNGNGFTLTENDGAELDSDLIADFNNCHLLMFEQD